MLFQWRIQRWGYGWLESHLRQRWNPHYHQRQPWITQVCNSASSPANEQMRKTHPSILDGKNSHGFAPHRSPRSQSTRPRAILPQKARSRNKPPPEHIKPSSLPSRPHARREEEKTLAVGRRRAAATSEASSSREGRGAVKPGHRLVVQQRGAADTGLGSMRQCSLLCCGFGHCLADLTAVGDFRTWEFVEIQTSRDLSWVTSKKEISMFRLRCCVLPAIVLHDEK